MNSEICPFILQKKTGKGEGCLELSSHFGLATPSWSRKVFAFPGTNIDCCETLDADVVCKVVGDYFFDDVLKSRKSQTSEPDTKCSARPTEIMTRE